jgi:UDP-2,3-diacylglucosamine pyrophosphatase LpxH
MRTLVISDLHLGNGGPYEAFAGAAELPAFLDQQAAKEPTRVFVNGDGVDFLMNDDPLQMDRARAVQQAQAIVGNPATSGVLRALGRVLAKGGEVTVRLGNHDLELSLPEVQAVIRAAMDQPEAVAARAAFQLGFTPATLDVGGARILVTHGEHDDKWNKVDYETLKTPETYTYTAGSTLVKQILNPLTGVHGLRFMNFLKPDFAGGTLTGLAVDAGIVKELFKSATLDILGALTRRIGMVSAFVPEEEDNGVGERLDAAALDADEKEALRALLGDAPVVSDFLDDGSPSSLSIKLARAGLAAYATFQRRQAKQEGADTFFALDPNADEWKDAKRLAAKEHVGAVIYGHTHAARWRESDGIVFANTGTWIWLMRLPPSDASSDTWADYLNELRQNRRLDPAKQKLARPMSRFTAVLLAPHEGGGADMSLVEWKDAKIETLGRSLIAPTRA